MQPNCFRCTHFVITHEAGKPYACRAMGFRSPTLPSQVVFQVSGEACLRFEAKANRLAKPAAPNSR